MLKDVKTKHSTDQILAFHPQSRSRYQTLKIQSKHGKLKPFHSSVNRYKRARRLCSPILCLIELLSLLLHRKDKKKTQNKTLHLCTVVQNIHIYTHNTNLAGISGRELRALASGTQMSCLVRIILIKNIVLPVCTFVWSIYNRLVCVALQPAVPIDEVHHVLCRGDGGNVDGEALQGEKTGCGCLTLQQKLLKKKKNCDYGGAVRTCLAPSMSR